MTSSIYWQVQRKWGDIAGSCESTVFDQRGTGLPSFSLYPVSAKFNAPTPQAHNHPTGKPDSTEP